MEVTYRRVYTEWKKVGRQYIWVDAWINVNNDEMPCLICVSTQEVNDSCPMLKHYDWLAKDIGAESTLIRKAIEMFDQKVKAMSMAGTFTVVPEGCKIDEDNSRE